MPTFVAEFTPPPPPTGLTASAESAAGVLLEWDPSTLSDIDFAMYRVFRSLSGQPTDYVLIGTIADQAQSLFIDYGAPIGRTLYYRVTTSNLDYESEPAETTSALDVCEYWLVTPGAPTASFELPNVTSQEGAWPLQRAEFEPLGRNRKLVETGELLGEEGALSCLLTADQAGVVDLIAAAMAGVASDLYLKTPWGAVLTVELHDLTRKYRTGGDQTVSFRFVQVA